MTTNEHKEVQLSLTTRTICLRNIVAWFHYKQRSYWL